MRHSSSYDAQLIAGPTRTNARPRPTAHAVSRAEHLRGTARGGTLTARRHSGQHLNAEVISGRRSALGL
eukprot:10150530-Heterocapsa_arctica.AAC.1